jgi:hypothetical protein
MEGENFEKIAAREQTSHTLSTIFWSTIMVGRQQLSGKLEEIRFTARGKDQPVLFDAAVCHPEQFFPLISLLPQVWCKPGWGTLFHQ